MSGARALPPSLSYSWICVCLPVCLLVCASVLSFPVQKRRFRLHILYKINPSRLKAFSASELRRNFSTVSYEILQGTFSKAHVHLYLPLRNQLSRDCGQDMSVSLCNVLAHTRAFLMSVASHRPVCAMKSETLHVPLIGTFIVKDTIAVRRNICAAGRPNYCR